VKNATGKTEKIVKSKALNMKQNTPLQYTHFLFGNWKLKILVIWTNNKTKF